MKRPTLRQVNDCLTVIVVLLAAYLVLAPFLPKATYKVKHDPPLVRAEKQHTEASIPDADTLVIPKIKLQETIHDSTSASALREGVWHPSQTGTPENGNNTVLTGHRFTYAGPAVFYNLDQVQAGDQIIVYWHHKKYRYEVTNVSVVSPNRYDFIAPTPDARLTIYTCTPLWTARNRLIIQAAPIGDDY